MKAIITGASNGIGKDMAEILAEKGFELVLVARSQNKLERLQKQLCVPVEIVCLDLSRQDSCFDLYRQYENETIDVLINNAGFGLFGAFDTTSLDEELNMIDLNIKAVHILTKLFLKQMKQNDHGFIMNVCSSASFFSGPLMSTYYAGKAYGLRLTQAIHEELRRSGSKVRICALCPGPVDTGFNERAGVSFSLKGLDSRDVAEYAIEQMFRGKLVIIPGVAMKLAKLGSRFLPDRIVASMAYHFQNRKR